MTNHTDGELLPARGTELQRNTARVIPVRRSDGRSLLLHGWDPDHVDQPFWFTIGGAVEAGEDLADAAIRELLEEVGLAASPDDLLGPLCAGEIRFEWAGRYIVQQQTFFALAVDDFVISFDGQDGLEAGTIDQHGWFTHEELVASGATFPEVLEAVRLASDAVSSGAPDAG